MKSSCFKSHMRITQLFGNEFIYKGKPYYARYGLLGHNGLDVVPTGEEKGIYNIFPGKIIRLEYNRTYGNRIAIWNKDKKLCEYHNHLTFIDKRLKSGMIIEKDTYLGEMGNTGFSLGSHDHIAFVETNSNGYRVNKDNGYNGWVDPLLYLK